MSDKRDRPSNVRHDGYEPTENKGYTPRLVGNPPKPQGGYQPPTSQGAPASVPKQPTSVQPPKK